MNEAEVRTNVIDVWLKDHGFRHDEILLERTFSIQLGRALTVIGSETSAKRQYARGRADYLVRSVDGRNLLIIEAKAMDEPLDQKCGDQAISYARVLVEGGIAPFAIVTNGIETRIYDTITRELLNDQCVPISHPHAASGFLVSGDQLLSRAEALEHLIGLSTENLQAFCNAQVRHGMSALRSESLDSGLKYIPSLYTPRAEEHRQLELLVNGGAQTILIVGPPQVGKTNLICHTVESFLESGVPCLFYPAVGLQSGLLEAIRNDFGWSFFEDQSTLQVVRRLIRVVLAAGKCLVLFIDGLNENLPFVRAFNSESERIQELSVATILSLTSYSALNILLDTSGNPTASARSAGLKKGDLFNIAAGGSSSSSKTSIVTLHSYSESEANAAYEIYANAYRVGVSEDHEKTADPQLLRSAMEVYRGRDLPLQLDAKDILDAIVREKLTRLAGIPYETGQAVLDEVARFLSEDSSVSFHALSKMTASPSAFVNAGLLAHYGRGTVDFYVTSERSFTIAYRLKQWDRTLRGSIADLQHELTCISRFETTREAFRWFLRQPPNWEILRQIISDFPQFQDLASRKLLVLTFCDFLENAKTHEGAEEDRKEEIEDAMNQFMPFTRSEASPVSDLLLVVLNDQDETLAIRRTSAIGLSSFSPQRCLRGIGRALHLSEHSTKEALKRALEPAFDSAIEAVLDEFYGRSSMGMCPSFLDGIEDDEEALLSEYESLHAAAESALAYYYSSPSSAELYELLMLLNPAHKTRLVPNEIQMHIPFSGVRGYSEP